jgi:hypothetical protein
VSLKPAEKAFYDELVAMAARLSGTDAAGAAIAEIHGLYLSGVCVASALCLRGAGERAVPKIGYDESQARLAPGHLLLEHLLLVTTQDASIRRLNMVSNAAWLSVWRPQRLRKLRLAIGVHTWAGPVQVALLRAGEAAWEHIRGLLRRPINGQPPTPTRAAAQHDPRP